MLRYYGLFFVGLQERGRRCCVFKARMVLDNSASSVGKESEESLRDGLEATLQAQAEMESARAAHSDWA